jgi:outer membrane receptor protein involved in Fe transport
VGFENGDFRHMLMATGTDSEGWQDDSGVDQQKLSWVYQYETDGGLRLDGGFTRTNLNQETAGYVAGPEAYKDSSLRETNPNPEAYRDNESLRVWTRFSQQLDNDWELVATPYFREANLNFIQHFLPGLPTEDSYHRSLGLQLAGYHDMGTGSYLAIGLDAESTEGRLLQSQENPTVGSAFLMGTIPQGKHYDYEVEALQIAPFVHYQHDFGNGWDVSLGLRYEQMDYEYDNLMIDGRTRENGVPCGFGGCRYNRPADRDDDFGEWSPKFGVRYQLNDQHNVQARVQRGFRVPQATELYRLQNAQTVADLDSGEVDS